MSSSREKRLGGCVDNTTSNSSSATKSNSKVEEGKPVSISSTEYRRKLRPRPTRQTERYRNSPQRSSTREENLFVSLVTSREGEISRRRKISEAGNQPSSNQSEQKISKLLRKKHLEKSEKNSSIKVKVVKTEDCDFNQAPLPKRAKKEAASGKQGSIKNSKESAQNKFQSTTGSTVTHISKSKATYSSSKKVFPKNKKIASKTSNLVTGQSTTASKATEETAVESVKRQSESSPIRGKLRNRKAQKHSRSSGKKGLSEHTHKAASSCNLTKKEGNRNKIKTGSCVSKRRGSVRSQASSASRSIETVQPIEPDNCQESNHSLMRKSKQGTDETTSRKRAANDNEGRTSSRQSTAETSSTRGATAAAATATTSNNDSESDDSDINRLQALLEARGLPPRLFSNLGPRMQQVLHRSMGTNSKVQQHLQGIQSEGNETLQLNSAIELCQMLVMGNEDTLAGFPVKSAVPALTNLLKMEHNFDLMNHACRALTYMMEALPHSSAVIVDAVPILLDKLQTIQCIDVAEQSLTALEILSRRHASAVLAAGGVSSCLEYIDFFSLPAQRSALSVTANCCYAVGTLAMDISGPEEEFAKFMKASLPLLSSRLSHHDKKCIETTCLCFVRLIDSFQQDSTVLSDIAGVDLLKNFQKLLVEPSSLLSSSMLVLVIHSMTILCSKLRELASQLLKDDITETLHYLLSGKPSDSKSEGVELLPRGSQETLEIASFIVQLLPRLPNNDPIFAVNNGSLSNGVQSKTIIWQWSDSSGHWQSYKRHESRILEMAYSRGETDIDLHIGDRSVSISFETMRQVDDNTGVNQSVQRILAASNENIAQTTSQDIKSDAEELANFVKVMFPVVAELYSTSAGFPPVRHVCLHALHQMVHFTDPAVLSDILAKLSLSSQISSMLSNPDTVIVVSAIQLAELVMRKLPEIFKEMFVREGVVHRIKNLSQMALPEEKPDATTPGTSRSSSRSSSRKSQMHSGAVSKKSAPYSLRISDQQSSTKVRPREQRSSTSSIKSTSSRPSRVTKIASSFFSNLNPTTWGKSLSSALSSKDEHASIDKGPSHSRSSERSKSKSKHGASNVASQEAKSLETDKWIKKQAHEFLEKHFKECQSKNNEKPGILDQLTLIATNFSSTSENFEEIMRSLCDILDSVEVSPFELIQSGVISALLRFLTTVEDCNGENSDSSSVRSIECKKKLDDRIRLFLSVYANLQTNPEVPITGQNINDIKSLPNLVRKLNQCVGRLEQFPVKSRELMSEGANIYHALTSRQLKCQLQRHPDCHSARRWLGGPIKIDPLIQMRAIERYLIIKGYGNSGGSMKQRLSASILFHDRGERNTANDDDDDDDDDDEDDHDDDDEDSENYDIEEMGLEDAEEFPDNSVNVELENPRGSGGSRKKQSAGGLSHRIEFYISNTRIPRQMTIYQALQQYGSQARTSSSSVNSERFSSSGSLLNNSSFWAKVHLLHYKLVKQDADGEEGSRPPLKSSKHSQTSRRIRDQPKNPLWFEGIVPIPTNPMHEFLTMQLPAEIPLVDPSLETLCLLRVIYAISRFWHYLYSPNLIHTNRPLVIPIEFINSEVNAKCMHQLEDPLVVITGQLSAWVQQIGKACPFLLSFEARQLLFRVTAFERNRALQHLHDSGITRTFSAHLGLASSSNSHSSSPSPFSPRIDKKKYSVSRKNLLQQAEKIMSEHAHSLAMIEVDYENEVGTGLGPTLEFFTLTSKEIQNTKLKLWREELKADDQSISDEKESHDLSTSQSEIELVKSIAGLFPRPVPHSAKHSQVSRICSKFKFLGKFLGKALLDGRLVDIPLSVACYKWLLGEESSFTGMDLDYVDPGLSTTFRKFCLVAHEREKILMDVSGDVDSLEMDGCAIEDLGLDMCLPGYANVELMKSGKTTAVTARNLDKYLNLLVHWTLYEGVKHQMNALREGFQSVIAISSLAYFYPEELDLLFCGSRYRPWDVQELSESCHPDHGYTQDSEAVKALFRVLSSYDALEQRNFLQFVTGCPHLPFGGLRSLNPPLTVVRKTCENSENPDNYLPSVMTCLNYLKLPEYSSEEVMRQKLKVAVVEGQKSFLLS